MSGAEAESADVSAPSVWNIANVLTVLRILMVPLFLWLLLYDSGMSPWHRFWAIVVFAAAMVTDRIDGVLARRYDLITDFGKIADPIADKALLGAGLIGLSILHELFWWVSIVILVREIGITLLRFAVIRHGVIAASRGGKLKTVLQTAAVGLFLLKLDLWFGQPAGAIVHVLAWIAMAAALIVTVLSGIDYLVQAGRLRAHSDLTLRRRAARQSGDSRPGDDGPADG